MQKSPKTSDFDKYSDYSDDKYDYEEEEDDYTDEMSEYSHSKDSSQGRGRHVKDQMKRASMRGMQRQPCMKMHFHILVFCDEAFVVYVIRRAVAKELTHVVSKTPCHKD